MEILYDFKQFLSVKVGLFLFWKIELIERVKFQPLWFLFCFRPEKGQSGFLVWRYFFRRDDPSPAPWEKGAKKYQCIKRDLCKDEGEEETLCNKITLELFKLDEETTKLVEQDRVILLDRLLI